MKIGLKIEIEKQDIKEILDRKKASKFCKNFKNLNFQNLISRFWSFESIEYFEHFEGTENWLFISHNQTGTIDCT